MSSSLLILGASARAAAFSALRAGLRPWCADLFADLDLRARCPVRRVPADAYPDGLLDAAAEGPAGPWLYTGALENRRQLVRRLAAVRPLWGNAASVLTRVRSPWKVAKLLCAAGLAVPALRRAETPPRAGRWLVKPLAGAGGAGIRPWTGSAPCRPGRHFFFQEWAEGEACAAIYCADSRQARLLGVTRQLVGEAWLHAGAFRYCGSVGPLPLPPALGHALQQLGNTLAAGCGLRGLFGVDFVRQGDTPWPVEVNPRYTASVEVLEYALGLPALAWHRRAFDRAAPEPPQVAGRPSAVVGKAILFARTTLTFPADGPWSSTLSQPGPIEEVPAFADLPAAGEVVPAGRPVLTFFARADDEVGCRDALQATACDLDRRLLGA